MTYVNIHKDSIYGEGAYETVYKSRYEATEAAEESAHNYLYTLSNEGRIDLRPDFSDEYKYAQAQNERTDHGIDIIKNNLPSFTMQPVETF